MLKWASVAQNVSKCAYLTPFSDCIKLTFTSSTIKTNALQNLSRPHLGVVHKPDSPMDHVMVPQGITHIYCCDIGSDILHFRCLVNEWDGITNFRRKFQTPPQSPCTALIYTFDIIIHIDMMHIFEIRAHGNMDLFTIHNTMDLTRAPAAMTIMTVDSISIMVAGHTLIKFMMQSMHSCWIKWVVWNSIAHYLFKIASPVWYVRLPCIKGLYPWLSMSLGNSIIFVGNRKNRSAGNLSFRAIFDCVIDHNVSYSNTPTPWNGFS